MKGRQHAGFSLCSNTVLDVGHACELNRGYADDGQFSTTSVVFSWWEACHIAPRESLESSSDCRTVSACVPVLAVFFTAAMALVTMLFLFAPPPFTPVFLPLFAFTPIG